MDTYVVNGFNAHISDSHIIQFIKVIPGLYLYDASNVDLNKLRCAFSFLNTVASNKSFFKNHDVLRADNALLLNRRLNHITKDKFIRIVKDNWIRNNPLTVSDVQRSHVIYGPPIPPLKGHVRYQNSSHIPEFEPVDIPKALHDNLKNVILCIDFHFVNEVTIFHTIS